METPPKVKGTYMYSQRGGPISEDILDQLYGNPRSTSTQNAKDQSVISQETIGSLSEFSLIDEDEYNEQGLESSRKSDTESISMRGVTMDNATQGMLEMNDKPKDGLETAGIGFTLPTPMVQELERDSPVLSRRELPSPIQSESPIDIFDNISSSAIGELERSTGSLTRNPQLRRLSGSSRKSQSRYTGAECKWPMEANSRRARSNTLEKERLSNTQDSDLEDLQLEPWVLISSTEKERSVHTDNHQDVREGDGYRDQYAMEATQDDVEGIRFSQLDDTFAVDMEATLRRFSMDKTADLQVERAEHRIEDIQKHPTQSPLTSSPPKGLGGFQTAFTISEAKLEKTPKLIQDINDLLRIALLYQDQAKASAATSSLYGPAGSSATIAGSTATRTCSGFKAGKDIPLAASEATCEREEDFFTEDDIEIQMLTGFKTGRAIPIAASKAARGRMEDFFAEDGMDVPRIPKTPGHVKTVPSLQPAQSKGSRFSSGMENALAASTRFAPANSDSILPRNLGMIKPDSDENRFPFSTPQPPSVTHTPSYTSLFHLP
ncbi:hypothetical protein BGX34_006398, partial [Mortierella sp. NVP85]